MKRSFEPGVGARALSAHAAALNGAADINRLIQAIPNCRDIVAARGRRGGRTWLAETGRRLSRRLPITLDNWNGYVFISSHRSGNPMVATAKVSCATARPAWPLTTGGAA